MAYTNIPTRTSSDLNAAADVNALMGNTDYILDIINPVGSWYTQYPSEESNTKTTAFPTEDEPAELFGGTWVQYYEDEGIFFKTEGDPLSQTDGENNNRTNGLQTDAGQGHYHRWESGGAQDAGLVDSLGFNSFYNLNAKNSDSAYIKSPTTDGTNGTPRTGATTRDRTYIVGIAYLVVLLEV